LHRSDGLADSFLTGDIIASIDEIPSCVHSLSKHLNIYFHEQILLRKPFKLCNTSGNKSFNSDARKCCQIKEENDKSKAASFVSQKY
jgi:hypothetical protein